MTAMKIAIESLEPGDHLCCIYETEAEHRAVLTPFLRQGLERGDKVVYIGDTHTAETLLGYLRDDGLDLESYLARQQLTILDKDEAYLKEGVFDPQAMIELLRTELAQALADGYPALRVTGQMTWALKGLPGSERLIEYETRLNEFLPGSKCLAICQYDKKRFEPAILLDVLRAHPKAVVGTTIYDNFYYIPPEELTADLPQAELRHWLANLSEHERVEEKLRASRGFLRTTYDAIRDAVIATDMNFDIISCNKSVERILGYTPDELIGKSYTVFVAEEMFKDPAQKERQAELFEKGYLEIDEYVFKRKNGELFPARFSVAMLKDGEGNPTGLIGTFRDITERVSAEQAGKQAEKLEASIFAISEAAHSTETLDDLFRSIHEIIAELMPARNCYIALYDAENKALSFPYFVDERDEKPARKKLGKGMTEYILRTGEPLLVSPEVFDELLKKGDVETMGTPAVDWLGVPLKTDDRTIGVLAVQTYTKDVRYTDEHKDILMFVSEQVAMAVERKRAQDALKSSEENFRNLFRLTSDAIVIQDKHRNIIDLNESAEQLFGYAKGELIGHPEIRLADYEKTDRRVAEERIERALAGEPQRFEWWGKKKNGRTFPEEIVLNKTIYDGEEVIFATIRDMTELKRAEEERERLNAELAQKNKELEQMIHVASHDLRAPLVNIQGFSAELERALKSVQSLLQSERVSSKVRDELSGTVQQDIPEALDYILSSTSKMESLVDGLLRLSRLGRATLKIKQLDMNKMLAEIVKGLEFQAKEAGATVEIGKLPPCKGDRDQINQVFSNLLDNALKYLEPDRLGRITVSGRKVGRRSVYCVEDNGVGIPVKSQDRVFEIFQRLDFRPEEGEGLGLSIVRRILDRHRGKVWVQSELGKGSRFYVSIPR